MSDNLFKKFISFSYGSWIGLIIGFLGTMLTTRILLPEDFGRTSMFTLALNISVVFIIFGTDQSFVRFFYEEKEENRSGLLYNCLDIPLVITLIIAIIILVFRNKVSILLFEEENFTAIIMLVIGIVFQVIYRYAGLVIRMQQKGNLYSILEILYRTLSVVTLLVLYFIMGSSYEIIIYSTVINLIILSTYAIFHERRFWNLRNRKNEKLIHSKRDIFDFGTPLVLTMLITWLFQSFDKIAIRYWSSFDELGLYAAAFKIIAFVSILQGTFSTFWIPVAYEKFDKEPENKNFFEKMCRIITFAMLLVAVLSIAGKDIIVFLLGKEYRQAANIMPFLVFMPIMYTISETTVLGINFFKKPKWHVLIASTSCIVNILGNWVLVPQYGAIGASISTAFSYVIFFTMRTKISLIYYKLNYGLKKLYLMLLVVSMYAMFSVFTASVYLNILMGVAITFVLLIVYKNDLLKGYVYIKKQEVFAKYLARR
ncbi:lipopolysaccharide biosynthesis protein [Geosporobacter ferrireducens]|uniref:Uncharacterized protein n=1 Tax=Geosporobacter ferrireducens TaxID=1424294 RepID=A0A1D8GGX4_9FIRM|nr:oligosaccharide flippase family protein [Geosporobacter ferrireducens]AOT70126.1 hypothetical protein Gferi_11310 [Geosporobacter ferrireducens]